MKKWHIVVIVLGLGVAAYFAMDLLMTERQRVSRVVRTLASRLSKVDGPGVCSLLTEDYHDSRHRSRLDARATLALVRGYVSSLSVDFGDPRVEVSGETATAEFLARVETRSAARDAGPETWSSRVKLRLKKVKGEWLIGEAEYQFPRQIREIE